MDEREGKEAEGGRSESERRVGNERDGDKKGEYGEREVRESVCKRGKREKGGESREGGICYYVKKKGRTLRISTKCFSFMVQLFLSRDFFSMFVIYTLNFQTNSKLFHFIHGIFKRLNRT